MSLGTVSPPASDLARTPAKAPAAEVWIIAPHWDLLLLIAAPLAIVPLVLFAATHWLAAERISLVVIALGSLGHHLPGYLRAYGDRELFARFRWRLLLAPVAVFGGALAFATFDLHGLALVLFFWATWHGLMQTYGFMRIYDLKRGVSQRQAARADFALCLTIFAAGLVFSDARVYGCADIWAKTGLRVPTPDALAALRWLAGGALALALVAYAWHLLARLRRGMPVVWPRLALIAITGWLYWFSGLLATDMLLGVAMFEIFHAVQYDAIVWATHRTRVTRENTLRRPLAAVFEQPRWASLALYLSLIVAFGAVRLIDFEGANSWVTRVLVALVTTSTFLHYYFDGFIWKVRERKTQADLAIASTTGSGRTAPAAWLGHAIGWTALVALTAGLFCWERASASTSDEIERGRLASLLALTPELPELQWRASDEARSAGDHSRAVEAATTAVRLRPAAAQSHERLGLALLASDRIAEAADAFGEAARLSPDRFENQLNLAIAAGRLDRWEQAEQAFTRAAELRPRDAGVPAAWTQMCLRKSDDAGAIEHGREALRLDPNDFELRASLVKLLARTDRPLEAVHLAERGVALSPQSPATHGLLGEAWLAADNLRAAVQELSLAAEDFAQSKPSDLLHAAECFTLLADAQLKLKDTAAARQSLSRAVELDPKSAGAWFLMANLAYAEGNTAEATRNYRRCLDVQPEFAPAYVNLASALLAEGDFAHARKAYERGLSLDPDNALAHYNLGLLLYEQGSIAAARDHLRRARQLGADVSGRLAEFIDRE